MNTITTMEQMSKTASNLPFENGNRYIESRNFFTLTLIRNMPCEKLWRVENENPENIAYISNSYKSLATGLCDIRFICSK